MHLLVLGANGLLGSNVTTYAQANVTGGEVVGTFHSEQPDLSMPLRKVDIRSTETIHRLITDHRIDVLVNCAAMTDVDACEEDPGQAYAVNADAPVELATLCRETNTRFVHISTDYVFDGQAVAPYTEDTSPKPVQVYGESKLAGDQRVRETMQNPLIVRPSFVWGVHRSTDELSGFPAWMRDTLRRGETVPLFTDQYVTPTRAGQAAKTIFELIETDAAGLFNVACRSCVTPNEFGQSLANRLEASRTQLESTSLAAVDRPAERPAYTCLSVEKLERELGRSQPALDEDIDVVEDAL